MFETNKKGENLNTNLYQKIMGDKVSLIASLKEQRDVILKTIESRYEKVAELKYRKKQIIRQIRMEKRAIIRDENERFELNRELNRQVRLSNKLNIKYSNEMDESINSQKFYPETVKKTR